MSAFSKTSFSTRFIRLDLPSPFSLNGNGHRRIAAADEIRKTCFIFSIPRLSFSAAASLKPTLFSILISAFPEFCTQVLQETFAPWTPALYYTSSTRDFTRKSLNAKKRYPVRRAYKILVKTIESYRMNNVLPPYPIRRILKKGAAGCSGKMRRSRQELPVEKREIMEKGTTGILGVLGDDDYPYTVPVNYLYRDGKIIFHGAKTDHKFDAMQKHDKVSFCVISRDEIVAGRWPIILRVPLPSEECIWSKIRMKASGGVCPGPKFSPEKPSRMTSTGHTECRNVRDWSWASDRQESYWAGTLRNYEYPCSRAERPLELLHGKNCGNISSGCVIIKYQRSCHSLVIRAALL